MSARPKITEARSCDTCRYQEPAVVFVLCKHEKSQYRIAGKLDYHTCAHMREHGWCGEEGRLHEPA